MYVQKDESGNIIGFARNAIPVESDSVTEKNPNGTPEAGWELCADEAEIEAFLSK